MSLGSKAGAEQNIQWPSLLIVMCCYAGWALATTVIAEWSMIAAVFLLALLVALHSSIQHEALHGHIFKSDLLRYSAVMPAVGIFVPYERFRETHLDHHQDINLTDPYDDPESNFMDPQNWSKATIARKLLLIFNNTLLGRILVGPMIGLVRFYNGDIRAIFSGNMRILKAHFMHMLGLIPVLIWVEYISPISLTAYLVAAYLGMGILKIRTFLEHRAHHDVNGRSVIIEDRGILALLFLNNNLHALHHEKPGLPWYQLPSVYEQQRDMILANNDHYIYGTYRDIFRQFLLKRKDPVAHPLR